MIRVPSNGDLPNKAPRTAVVARSDMLSSAATVLMSAATVVSSGSTVLAHKSGDAVSTLSAVASIMGGSASLVATAMSSYDTDPVPEPEIYINDMVSTEFLKQAGVAKLAIKAENIDGKFVITEASVSTFSSSPYT